LDPLGQMKLVNMHQIAPFHARCNYILISLLHALVYSVANATCRLCEVVLQSTRLVLCT